MDRRFPYDDMIPDPFNAGPWDIALAVAAFVIMAALVLDLLRRG
jgi:hypothetical protein